MLRVLLGGLLLSVMSLAYAGEPDKNEPVKLPLVEAAPPPPPRPVMAEGRVRVKFADGTEIEAEGMALLGASRLTAQIVDSLAARDGVLAYKSTKDIGPEKLKEVARSMAPAAKAEWNEELQLLTVTGEERDLRRVAAAVRALRFDNQPAQPMAIPLPLPRIPAQPGDRLVDRKRFVAPPRPGEVIVNEPVRHQIGEQKLEEGMRGRLKIEKKDNPAGNKTPDREFEF